MIDTYLKANGFQQTIQQVQNQLSTDGCRTSKSAYVDYSANSIHYLSDIIRIFGDLGVGYAEQHYTINESPIIKIEAYVDVQRPNTFTTNYTIPTNIKNEKENNKMNNMFDSFNGMFGKLGAGLCRLSMNGNMGDLFGGIFDFDDEESDAENEENEDEESKAEN